MNIICVVFYSLKRTVFTFKKKIRTVNRALDINVTLHYLRKCHCFGLSGLPDYLSQAYKQSNPLGDNLDNKTVLLYPLIC